MSASVVHLAHAGPLLGTEDSTISRLVPGMTAEFLKGAETEAEKRLLPLIEFRNADTLVHPLARSYTSGRSEPPDFSMTRVVIAWI
jgi:hypothetical protein